MATIKFPNEPLEPNEYFKMVKECLSDDSDQLTAWEIEFLESYSKNSKFYIPSEKQAAVIERIWNKLFS